MIEDSDEGDEDEGPAPSSGEFRFCVIWAFMNELCALPSFLDFRSIVAKLEPRSFHVSFVTTT